MDYVTNNTNTPASVYKNHATEISNNHFLRVSLEGSPANRAGYGAKLFLFTGNDTLQYFEQSPYRGFQSSVDQQLHVGLGKSTRLDSLLIVWPDQRYQKLENVAVDQQITLKWKDAERDTFPSARGNGSHYKAKFFPANESRKIQYRHQETEYADFKIEPLLPHKYSENGPGIAVGDINGDALEDFFVGGAYNQSGQFFIQQKDGSFLSKGFTKERKYEEDMGVLLFDADNDDDNDLYIVSGGNEFESGSPYYQHRLYFNDGNGNFKLNNGALPEMTSSGSCVIAADLEKDGDLDLFVGGRLTPHGYPQSWPKLCVGE